MSFWDTFLPGGLGAYGYSKVQDDISSSQDNVSTTIDDLSTAAAANTQFQPWGVTSNTGSSTADGTGIGITLSPEQQAMQQQLFGGAAGMFNNATMDPAAREQEIYGRARAMMLPGEERARQQMDQRLFSQGRSGISSVQGGGGTPEQMAYYAAVEEAKNKAAFDAMGQAQDEMVNYNTVGSSMLGDSYSGINSMLAQMGIGTNNAQLNQQGQLEGAGLMAQLGLGGLTADTNFQGQKTKAFGDMITAGGSMLGGLGGAIDDGGGFWNWLGISNPFSGGASTGAGGAAGADIDWEDLKG